MKATTFLLQSLYWLKGKESGWFDRDDDFPHSLSIYPTTSTRIKLAKIDENWLVFSYTPQNENHLYKRGDRYFAGIGLDLQHWISQVNIALGEYFQLFSLVLEKNDTESKIVDIMMEYRQLWRNIATG